jgi:lysyl-tRNA synthetase class 2
MTSGRFGDTSDGRAVVVTAHDAEGQGRGLLSLVPWGRNGAALDIMRHDPAAHGGTMELMVAGLMEQGRDMGIERVSLNFAVFRRALEAGDDVGAFPLQRFGYRLAMLASRWWQIDSLYRSNQKYAPDWKPRLLCFDQGASLSEVLTAVGRAEGYLPDHPVRDGLRRLRHLPGIAGRRQRLAAGQGDPTGQGGSLGPTVPTGQDGTGRTPSLETFEAFVAAVRRDEARALAVTLPPPKLSGQQLARRAHRQALEQAGIACNPVAVPQGGAIAQVAEGQLATVCGRIMRKRHHGGLTFLDLREGTAELQVAADRTAIDAAGRAEDYALLVRHVQPGDLLSVTGQVGRSKTGQLTLFADRWDLAAKSLVPMVSKRRLEGQVPKDSPAMAHTPHLMLATRDAPYNMVYARAAATLALRQGLERRGFIEVETPILQPIHGGANARPFATHINAYDQDLYLRIAPELYLKRLAVGGVERLFELGRNFRNEGVDRKHNPEFTSLEAYQAFSDYQGMRQLTESLIREAAVAVNGEPVAIAPDGQRVDLSGPWRVETVCDAVGRACGEPVTMDTPLEELRRMGAAKGADVTDEMTVGEAISELYDALVEGATFEPTFYLDFPVDTSPLTRRHRQDPRLAERWDLVAFGTEMGTAYSELTDPLDERGRLTTQSVKAAAGDPEAMELDEDFLTALEFGLPPMGGLGLGVDRTVMMLTGTNIRQTLTFPFVRPSGGI